MMDELIEKCASDLFSEHWNGARTWAEVTDKEREMYTRMAKHAAHHFAAQLAAAEKELFELQTCMSGRFWMCMKCQRITHSHHCVHQCLCGNWPSSGYFASATFGQWELQNQGAFAAWRADRLAAYPPKPASGMEQGQRGGEG